MISTVSATEVLTLSNPLNHESKSTPKYLTKLI